MTLTRHYEKYSPLRLAMGTTSPGVSGLKNSKGARPTQGERVAGVRGRFHMANTDEPSEPEGEMGAPRISFTANGFERATIAA
jgi:hypothetical protein